MDKMGPARIRRQAWFLAWAFLFFQGTSSPAALEGQLEFIDEQLVLRVGETVFKMGLKPPYTGNLVIDHVKIMELVVVTSVAFQGDESPFKGTFHATQMLINYVPVSLFHGNYQIKDGSIFLSSCQIGESYEMDGTIGLQAPYAVSMSLRLKETPVSEIFWVSKLAQSGSLSGMARGEWNLSGPMSALQAKGAFEVTNGQLGQKNPIYFSSLFFHLEGTLPVLSISEVRLNSDQGVLLAKGEIDLRQWGKGNLLEAVKFYSDTKTMRWKGWDIQTASEKDNSDNQVRVGRNLSQDMRVSFRSFINDEVEMAKPGNNRKEFELEYRFQKNKRIKMQLKGHEEFLGLENRVRF